jgi:hypothetical protein
MLCAATGMMSFGKVGMGLRLLKNDVEEDDELTDGEVEVMEVMKEDK